MATNVGINITGLGKTTLARRLFEHEEVDGKFTGKKVWICVSEDFHVDKILKEMVESLKSTKCDLTNTDAIIKQLEDELKGKKFFLVLDDVWNDDEELWDSLKALIQRIGGLNGSVILITTRSRIVARKARALYSHNLEVLSEEHGWALLKQQVFIEKMPYDSSFDDVGRRIVVEKCKGVPLAIKSIGGLLQSKQHKSEWELIENSELWNIKEDDKNYIMPSLLLSYNHMDHVYVRQCFAYCAIFPKDSVMEKDQLISLWLAEGLLHDDSKINNTSATLEIIGEKYIEILVNYSFLQEENEYQEIKYKMHDLVYDLAAYISKKDLLVWKAGDKLEDVDNSQLRHLVLNYEDNKIAVDTFLEEKMRKLRTIIFCNEVPSWNSLICSRYLRILVMAKAGLTEIPCGIGQLVHLRYLDLSMNNIKALPGSICKLYQLQTLRLLWCYELNELPTELHRLTNIRHIKTSFPMFASRGLGSLTSLQTLPCLELQDKEGWTVDELGSLNQAKGDLYLKGLEFVKSKEEAREAALGRKESIMNLILEWGSNSEGNDDEDVLGSLEPHPNIQSLLIDGFKGVGFPWWIMSMSVKQRGHPIQLSHLKEVVLRDCKRCHRVPSLGQLPHLSISRLYGFDEVECIGEEFYEVRRNNTNDVATEVPLVGATVRKLVFPALRELYIENLKKLAMWMPPSSAQTAFPKLETLEIKDCGQLETVPALNYESLKDLKLENLKGIQPLDIIKGIHDLRSLEVQGMEGMLRLPEELSNCKNMQILVIMNCENMKWIPSGVLSLKELKVKSCPSLGSIEDGVGVLQGLTSLTELAITECARLKRMPKNLEDCTSLKVLEISDCPLIEEEDAIIPDIGKLRGLTGLKLYNAGRLTVALPQWISQLDSLHDLEIGGWEKEWDMTLVTSTLTSLRSLALRDCPNLKPLPLPAEQQSLRHLFFPFLHNLALINIWEMEQLPEWIGNLSSLQNLWLQNCKNLKYLPSEQAMSRLSKFSAIGIFGCPLLKERCDKHNNGPEWPKISHLSCVHII